MGVQSGDGAGGTTLTDGTTAFSSLVLCSAGLPDKIAISVDAQMDDGLGKKGSVRAKKAAGNPADIGAAEDYTEDGVSTYVVCRQM
jgi:hypothetical protein